MAKIFKKLAKITTVKGKGPPLWRETAGMQIITVIKNKDTQDYFKHSR